LKTIKELFPGATQLGKEHECESGAGTYSGEYIQQTLDKWAKEWIEHFKDRFNIGEGDMPQNVRMKVYEEPPEGKAIWVYGKDKSKREILTWNVNARQATEENRQDYNTKIPGAGIIAFIMYNLDLEEEKDEPSTKSN